MTCGWRQCVRIGAVLALFTMLSVPAARGQAWLPNPGEGAVSILYQSSRVDNHLLNDGTKVDAGQIQSQGVLVDLTYTLAARTAIAISLPFVGARYDGSRPHPGSLLDDGAYHEGFQDLRFDVRYNAVNRGFALTPFVGTILPASHYPYYGHAAIGRNVKELQVGAYVARLLDPMLPGGFVQARYSYGFAERVLDMSHNRSILDLELGYFVNPKLRAFGLASGQVTHGGILLTHRFPRDLTPEEFFHHDQLNQNSYFDLGGGAQVSLTSKMDVFASIVHTMTGTNGHALTYSATVGASWSFKTAGLIGRSQKQQRLVRCLCEKGK